MENNKIIVYMETQEVKNEIRLEDLVKKGADVAKGTNHDGWTTSDYIHATAVNALLEGVPAVSTVQFKADNAYTEVPMLVVMISGGAHINMTVDTHALDFMDGVTCSVVDAGAVISGVIRAYNDHCVRDRDRILAGSAVS